jgi:hypothetical protein
MVVVVLATQQLIGHHLGRTTTLVVSVAVGVISYLGVLSLVDRSLLRSVLRDISRRHRAEQVPA